MNSSAYLSGDKMGFAVPASPGDSLRLLNDYMHTDLLRPIHLHLHRMKDNQEEGAPIQHLVKSLELVLGSFEGENLFDLVDRNPFHVAPIYPFDAEKGYLHDIKLMKHHLNCQRKTIEELNSFY